MRVMKESGRIYGWVTTEEIAMRKDKKLYLFEENLRLGSYDNNREDVTQMLDMVHELKQELKEAKEAHEKEVKEKIRITNLLLEAEDLIVQIRDDVVNVHDDVEEVKIVRDIMDRSKYKPTI